jgi:hypothetical protein
MSNATDARVRVRAFPRAAATGVSRPRADTHELGAALEGLRREARARPYPMVAAATAIGFVLGGGLTVRLAAGLLGSGARAAALGLVTGFASGRRPVALVD